MQGVLEDCAGRVKDNILYKSKTKLLGHLTIQPIYACHRNITRMEQS